jgi:hypothetical protein
MKTYLNQTARLLLVALLCASPLVAQRTRRGTAKRGTRHGGSKVARRDETKQVAATPISFASGASATDIPFELYTNVIFVQVRVNDSAPLSFIFDTGAGINVLNAERASEVQLQSASVGVNARGTGGTVAGTLATGATISLPGVAAHNQRIAVLPLQSIEPHVGRRVDGILGYDFINSFVVEIDYEKSLMSFHDPRTYRPTARAASVPIKFRGGTPYVNTSINLTNADTVAGEFEIDTGSDGALGIYDYFAKAHNLRRRLPRVSSAQKGAGVGGETSSVDARVRGFSVGQFAIRNPVVSISEDDKDEGGRPKYDGMIGTEVFRRFRVRIDYAHSRLLLTPNRFFNEPYETDMSGINLVAEGEDLRAYRITEVEPHSPASDAGVRANDLIEEIDGRVAAAYSLDQIARMFQLAGREYTLTLRRGDQTVRVTMRTKRMI